MREEIIKYFENKGFTSRILKSREHFVSNNHDLNGNHVDIQGCYSMDEEVYIVDVRLIGKKHVEWSECFEYENNEESPEQIIKDVTHILTQWVGEF